MRAAHNVEQNCTPRSKVKQLGTPKGGTHPLIKTPAQLTAAMNFTGNASAQRVEGSMATPRPMLAWSDQVLVHVGEVCH
jgi:hypothetical protein